LVLVVMNIAYALSAYPVGALSDRVGSIGLLAIGLVLLIVADLFLAYSASVGLTMLGIVLWGLHMGFTQGIFSALVAGAGAPGLRGTAFGIYNLVTGIVLLVASALAGILWTEFSASATFLAGAAVGLVCLAGLVPLKATLTGR
jgi:MFS family permease